MAVDDWGKRKDRVQFGDVAHVSRKFMEEMASTDELERVAVMLVINLAKTLKQYGYEPEMETLKMILEQGNEWEWGDRVNLGAAIWARFKADPESFVYALDAEVQKLRDLLAGLVETGENEEVELAETELGDTFDDTEDTDD